MYIIDTPSPYMNMLNITIKFKNLSRYSTHQLVRHRDAITGESQRYVNFSDIGVNNPFVYDEDNQENVNKKFKLNLPFVDKELFLTPDEIGTMQHQIYNDLVKQGVNNETARGYLPQTTISGDYYMTFTRSNLCKFLDLRLDPHAQGEIREAANLVFDLLSKYPELSEDFICKDTEDDNRFNSLCRIALKPRYVYSNTSRSEFYDEVEDDGLTEEIYRTIEFEDEDGNPQVMRYEDIKVGTSKKEDV
jgi:flavin-dependent thymidylate synthase